MGALNIRYICFWFGLKFEAASHCLQPHMHPLLDPLSLLVIRSTVLAVLSNREVT